MSIARTAGASPAFAAPKAGARAGSTDFGTTAIARRTSWLLDRYIANDLTDADVQDSFTDELPVGDWQRMIRALRRPIDSVGEYQELSPVQAEVALVCEGRAATLRTLVGEEDDRLRAGGLMLPPLLGSRSATRPSTTQLP